MIINIVSTYFVNNNYKRRCMILKVKHITTKCVSEMFICYRNVTITNIYNQIYIIVYIIYIYIYTYLILLILFIYAYISYLNII